MNWCKKYPHKEAQVYLVKDWEQFDEEGYHQDLYKLKDVFTQTLLLDDGMDFIDVHEVLLEFEEERV